MQESKTAIDGSNAIAPPKVLSVVGERFHCRSLRVSPRLQRQHVLKLRAAMLANISEREVASVHVMHDQRSRDSQDICRVVRTELLILGEDRDTLALEEMAERSLEQGCSRRGQPDNLVLARLAADLDLYVITLAELAQRLGSLALLIGELDELQHLGGHDGFLFEANIKAGRSNCNI